MVITWIGYCLLVSALLGLAAYASERALGHYRKPVRWGWFAAIAGSVTAPIVAFVAPGLFPSAVPSPMAPLAGLGELGVAPSVPAVPDLMTGAQAAGGLDVGAVSALLGWAWALLVLAMGFHLVRAYGRLRSEMRTWTPAEVQGSPVLLSANRGPAVVGVGCSVVVMPRWISDLEDRLLRLVFLHEREHQRAGDHRLFAAGIAALVLMPWNLFLWWQVSRLRLAIEFDCDRRVLARGESTRDYADALLAVGSRVSAPLMAAAAFAERKPAVERRLRRMTEPLARLRVTRTLGASGVAALAIILVLGAPRPEASMDAPEAPAVGLTTPSEAIEWTAPPVPSAEEIAAADRPVFIPYDTNPVLKNGPEVHRALIAAYPADLKAQGTGGRIELWVFIDETGVVRRSVIKTMSGIDALNRAAMEVVHVMRFQPAMNRDQPTAVWVSQWIVFQAEPAADRAESSSTAESDRLTFVAFDANPVLQNAGEVQRALQEAYPLDLRDRGVGGRAEIWLYIDESGVVANQEMKTSSGVDALDRGAMEVVKVMRFEPAKNRGQPTAVWISQWVTFQVVGSTAREQDGASSPADRPFTVSDIPVTGVVKDLDHDGVAEVILVPGAVDEPGPLIVIDGVIQSNDVALSDLEALDIDNVEVIKGSLAIESYGEAGRNGVIHITTKKKE
ncbi:TonB family protein [Candidatus Palauibacter sp.]|uniref:TonB family protein n=1 Tax=Candidatus Palauibacter sp. TaxID=3101350 RepID=UPI003B0133C0